MTVREQLLGLQDIQYRDFTAKLVPNIAKADIIGIRTPVLRMMAKELSSAEADAFINELPHKYFDEYNLHGLLLSQEKDFDKALSGLEQLLPYIDNWASCDIIAPRSFKRNTDKLLPHIYEWLGSNGTYTVRFGIGMLLKYYLDAPLFSPQYLEAVAEVKSDEYYVNMMIAWYFATALAKQYMDTLPYIEGHRLSDWVHRKAIQKSVESRRISDEHKQYLRSLK